MVGLYHDIDSQIKLSAAALGRMVYKSACEHDDDWIEPDRTDTVQFVDAVSALRKQQMKACFAT